MSGWYRCPRQKHYRRARLGRSRSELRTKKCWTHRMSLRHVSEFLYCPVIFGECEEDAASCDCSYHENMREAEMTHKDDDRPKCHMCGFTATVHLIHWYCPICYAGLNATHSAD